MVKQETVRVTIDILGISELKWTRKGEFKSDDHFIYYCGQESLRRNRVALIVNKKSPKCSTWVQSQKQQNDLCSFPGQGSLVCCIPRGCEESYTNKQLNWNLHNGWYQWNCSDFETQYNKICHCFQFFPIYLWCNDRIGGHILVFWTLNFKPTFSLFSFTLIKRLTVMLNSFAWKQTKIILLFLRLHPSTAF